MSRKDYKAIAYVIEHQVEQVYGEPPAIDALRAVADGLATVMIRDNPRFNHAKFMEACGFYA